jgi:Tfp pilus assembly protein PilF
VTTDGKGSKPGERLERALAAFLAVKPSTRAEIDGLLAGNPDLHDLLTPMLAPPELGDDGADANAAADATAERVLGDFRLVRELGRGGMGIVYEAWQRSLDRKVALKVLAPGLVAKPSAVARFRREATAAGRLQHENLVEVHGFGSAAGEHFFAMELVDGAPLQDVAERFREPRAAVLLTAQLADALAHAHGAGLVHRDVKPGNVLVRTDGTPLLTDFGVARDEALPALTHEGTFVGTLDYASPEQVRGEPVDAGSDVWSLGVILHELLSGSHPFSAPTQEATMHRVLTAEPPRLRGRPGVSDDLAAVVDHALAKVRSRRYATMVAMRDDLRAVANGEPVSVRLPTGGERLRRWAAREPWRAFAAAVLLVGVPILTGVVGYLWANAPRIEAATAAEAKTEREETISEALTSLLDNEPAAGLAALARLVAPEDFEVAVLRAQLLSRAGDRAAAHAALAGHEGPLVQLLHAAIDRPQTTRLDAADEPADAFAAIVEAQILLEGATNRGIKLRPLLQRVLQLTDRAVMLAPAPRISYFVTMASASDLNEDRPALLLAASALAKHFPDSLVGWHWRARCLSRHEPQQALDLAERIERSTGPSARSWSYRGVALEFAGKLEAAADAYRRSLELGGNPTVRSNLGAVLRKQKLPDEATRVLRQALDEASHKADIWNVLGLTRRDAGDDAEAKQAFERALELRPDYMSAAYNLGNLLTRSRNYEGAAAAFRTAIAAEPDDVRSLANLGDALCKLGREEEALQYSWRAAALAPNDLIPNHNVARLALDLGLPKLALIPAERARKADKRGSVGAGLHAEVLLAQDPPDVPAAVAAAREADERAKSGKLEYRLLLVRVLVAARDRAGAADVLRASLADSRFAEAADQDRLKAELAELTDKPEPTDKR